MVNIFIHFDLKMSFREVREPRSVRSERNVAGPVGESVKKTDLREAAFLVGLNRPDEVSDTLRERGYDFE